MKLMKNIVLAMDLSEGASDAARVTVSLAGRLGAEIAPVHVIPKGAESTVDKNEIRRVIDAQLRAKAEEQAGGRPSILETAILFGTPFEQIIEHAETNDAGAIILAAKGRTSGVSQGLGVTASRVVRHATTPVLAIRKGSDTHFRRILCPVDMSDSSARALRNAARLARAFRAELTVINVLETADWWRPSRVATQKPQSTLDRDALGGRSTELDKFIETFDLSGVSVDKRIEEGDPYEKISETLANGRFDLLAMGTIGRSGVARILVGGVAERLIRNSSCSLLVVKSQNILQPQLENDLKTINESFDRALSLLDEGFAAEAISELRIVTVRDRFYAPAWEALAVAYERTGDHKNAKHSEENARQLRDSLYSMQVRRDAVNQWKKKKIER